MRFRKPGRNWEHLNEFLVFFKRYIYNDHLESCRHGQTIWPNSKCGRMTYCTDSERGHILKSHDIYMLFPSYPRFQAGIHLKERQPGLPITNAGNGTFFSSSPQVVGGDPSEQTQDGFPITNVGNDDDGEGFRINNVGR